MDTIKITTNGIPLKSAALDPAGTIHGYRREDAIVGHEGSKPNPGFVFPAKGPELLRVYTKSFGPGDLRIHRYRANLPKFLYGHNGRLIQSHDDFLLALTRLRHVLKQLVDRQYWPFLLPNAEDPNNLGHLTYLESTWHVHDPNHVLLAAAMGARMPGHSLSPFLVPGETATIRGSMLALKFYDKVREALSAPGRDPQSWWTRLEATFKSPERLHRSVFRDGQFPGAGAVRTITFDDAYGGRPRPMPTS